MWSLSSGVMVAISAVGIWLAVAAWRRRPAVGATLLGAFMVALVAWSLATILVLTGTDISVKILAERVGLIVRIAISVSWVAFSLQYSGRSNVLGRRNVLILGISAVALVLLTLTDSYHGLVFSRLSSGTGDWVSYGVGFWLLYAYCYVMALLGALLVVNSLLRLSNLSRGHIMLLIVTASMPVIAYSLSVIRFSIFQSPALMPAGYFGLGLGMTLLVYRHGMAEIIPVARSALVEMMADPVYVVDANGRMLDLNPAAERLVRKGGVGGPLIGSLIVEVLPDLKVLDRMPGVGERGVTIHSKEGSDRYYDISISSVGKRGEGRAGQLIVLHDISYQKMIEDQLRRIGSRLEEEVGERTRELTATNRALAAEIETRKGVERELRRYSEHLQELVDEKAQELRNAEHLAAIGQTASMVGHDLRNPLQAVMNNLYLVRKGLKKLKPKDDSRPGGEISRALGAIDDEVGYMNKIVMDLQDFARPTRLDLKESDIPLLVRETLSRIEVPENVEVSVSVPPDFPRVVADPHMLSRVFQNLTLNAVQAMPRGGSLRISLRTQGGTASISFRDTGVGVPKANLGKLFQPLFTTKAQGQGFGLAVCKKVVEAHGGRILLKSEVGKGSTFTVNLPLKGVEPISDCPLGSVGGAQSTKVSEPD